MSENIEKIKLILSRLELLEKKQELFSMEMESLRVEIGALKDEKDLETRHEIQTEENELAEMLEEHKESIIAPPVVIKQPTVSKVTDVPNTVKSSRKKSDLEKFIGENLISKIGIAITVIGVAIGARYAIEHQMISPLTRIVLGYLFGLGMLVTGALLKKNYFNFSAVLVSGSLSILYFITYSAYGFYQLIPQVPAFIIMVLFTAFAVVASIHYNRQIIALIGLVGAYAVPFLLSDGSGRVVIMFSYMTIINSGILIIAFKKYWKLLYYSSFIFTWLIFASWFFVKYNASQNLSLSFIFLFLFFVLFYMMFLVCKLIQKEKLNIGDIILILSNSFIFYGFGYALVFDMTNGENFPGLFTLCNAIIHFVVTFVIYKRNLGDRNLFYFVSGLVLIFITLAIPVQLDGNWVTLLWAGEAALLFGIGRIKGVGVYEKISYPLMLLAFFSILHDWSIVYDKYIPEYPETRINFLFNINFLSSVLFIGVFAFINLINRNTKYSYVLDNHNFLKIISSFLMPAILLVTLYFAFFMEISNYWEQLYKDSSLTINRSGEEYPDNYSNYDLLKYKIIWLINYSLLFFAVLSLVNIKKFKSCVLGYIILFFNIIHIPVFLFLSLYLFSELRQSYIEQDLAEYYSRGIMNIIIRYISLLFLGAFMFSFYLFIRGNLIKENFIKQYYLLLHITLLWIASSEVINWMDIAGSSQSHKLGLSILWGCYSLLLVVLGIWKKAPFLRISAIVLFGITLVKLFFYDIAHLDTIAKTVVLVSLGLLMLVISFLYNKYRNSILEE